MPSRISETQAEDSYPNGSDGHGVTDAFTEALSGSDSIPSHPLGVKPLGNQYLTSTPNARRNIGTLQRLPDEMLMLILERLDGIGLQRLASCGKFFYALCESEDLWKGVFLQ